MSGSEFAVETLLANADAVEFDETGKIAGPVETMPSLFEWREIEEPFPGLRPFEPWQAEIFFGREAHTKRLFEILGSQHFLAVIGPSGSGKSSLVRAGLLPQLPDGRLGTGSSWRVAIMKPGIAPLRNLARALLQPDALGQRLMDVREDIPKDAQTLEVALLEARLRQGPLSLVDVATAAQANFNGDDNLLVLVDQFEELFTYIGAEGKDKSEDALNDAEIFVNLLLAARADPEARLFVVLTMRTDFLGQCTRFLDLPDAINRAQYLTPRLSREEIRQVIEKPLEYFGGGIDPSLTVRLINGLAKNPDDQLPILQHALNRMWTLAIERERSETPRIGVEDYKGVGEMKLALNSHADAVLRELGDGNDPDLGLNHKQEIVKRLFVALTEQRRADEGGQTVRRPQSLACIAKWAECEVADLVPAIKAYSAPQVSFLKIDYALNYAHLDENAIVDISHEALIRQWSRLSGWVAEEAERAEGFRRLLARANEMETEAFGAALLTATSLSRAQEWLNGGARPENWRPSDKWVARYLSADDPSEAKSAFERVKSYVRESARVVESRNSRRRRLFWGGVAILVCLCVTFGSLYRRSLKAEESTRSALALTLWFPIESKKGLLTEKGKDAMLAVARASNDVADAFLKFIHDDDIYAERFFSAPALMLSATIGISPKARDEFLAASVTGGDSMSKMRDLAMVIARFALEDGDRSDQEKTDELANAIASFQIKDTFIDGRAIAKSMRDLASMASAGRVALLREAVTRRIEAAVSADERWPWITVLVGLRDSDKNLAVLLKRLMKVRDELLVGEKEDLAPNIFSGLSLPSFDDDRNVNNRKEMIDGWLRTIVQSMKPVDALALWKEFTDTPVSELTMGQLNMLPVISDRLPEDQIVPAMEKMVAMVMDAADIGIKYKAGESEKQFGVAKGLGGSIYKSFQMLIERVAVGQTLPMAQRIVARASMRPDKLTSEAAAFPLRALVRKLSTAEEALEYYRYLKEVNWADDLSVVFGKKAKSRREVTLDAVEARFPGTVAAFGKMTAGVSRSPSGGAGKRGARAEASIGVNDAIERIKATTDPSVLSGHSVELSGAIDRLLSAEIGRWLDTLLSEWTESQDMDQREAFAAGIVRVLERLKGQEPPDLEQKLFNFLKKARARTSSSKAQLRSILDIYLRLQADVVDSRLQEAHANVVELLGVADDEVAKRLMERARKLSDRFSPPMRQTVVESLVSKLLTVEKVNESERTDFFQPPQKARLIAPGLNAIADVVTDLLPQLDSKTQRALRRRLLEGVLVDDPGRARLIAETVRKSLNAGLTVEALAGKKPEARFACEQQSSAPEAKAECMWLADEALAHLKSAKYAHSAEALVDLARGGLKAQDATADVAGKLFELMKYPVPRQKQTADVVRNVFKAEGAPAAEAGQWVLIDWAKKKYSKIDFDSPAPSYIPLPVTPTQ